MQSRITLAQHLTIPQRAASFEFFRIVSQSVPHFINFVSYGVMKHYWQAFSGYEWKFSIFLKEESVTYASYQYLLTGQKPGAWTGLVVSASSDGAVGEEDINDAL